MVVGGPNARKDYHVDPGAGVLLPARRRHGAARPSQDGRVVDVPIRAGEMLLIPPQRAALAAAPGQHRRAGDRAARGAPASSTASSGTASAAGSAVRGVLRAHRHREAVSAGVRALLRAAAQQRTCSALRHGAWSAAGAGAHRARAAARSRIDLALARGPGACALDFAGTAAAPLRRAARQRAAVRGAGGFNGSVDARRELQLRGHHADPALQRHAHRVRRPSDARARSTPGASCPPACCRRCCCRSTPGRAASGEGSDPAPQAGDRLITRARARARLAARTCRSRRARSSSARCPTTPTSATRDYTRQTPPYLSREAAQLLVSRGIEHLVVDVPSIDRAHDDGRLTAHRIFFGLPPAAAQLARRGAPARHDHRARLRPRRASPTAATCWQLQVPALAGDAVPSRPLLYPLQPRPTHEQRRRRSSRRAGARRRRSAARAFARASRCRATRDGEPLRVPVRPLARPAPLAAREHGRARSSTTGRASAVLGPRAGAPPVDSLSREPDRGPGGAHRGARRTKWSP